MSDDDAVCVMLVLRSLSMSSSTPVTVTVCVVSQVDEVNVRLAALSVATPVSPLAGVTVTSAVGSLSSTTV